MIDVEKVRRIVNSFKSAKNYLDSIYDKSNWYDDCEKIDKTITELDRLQKFNDVISIIESGYKAIESGEAFEHGFPESRLIPSNWNELCLKTVLDEVIEKITPVIKEYLQDELTYQEVINDGD